ncbi:hypothetical protein [Treponema pedis]|uniref:hypothetical protein n=1 Tax=Treponema pedis TaxID=409322 RepID=UPI00040DE801|nr:hypothetical protein [Treponema pedis]QSI04451.1 hypothetical protein DYQ05_05635 [Treponema pedis]
MSNVNLFPHKKNKPANCIGSCSALSIDEIHAVEEKLEDPEYMDAAIYRLATIITDRILSGGLNYEQEEI